MAVQLYHGGDCERDRRTRKRRAAQIKSFADAQRRTREWINFAEIADWCSELASSVVSNEAARASACEKLQQDLLACDFEENDHSRVLYLHPWTKKAKMTCQGLLDATEACQPETVRSNYLDHCWLPRNLFQQWCAKHHLPESPARFQPQKSRRVSVAICGNETAAAKALASLLRTNSQLSRADAVAWCDTEGFKLTARGFQNRVWPDARKLAKLGAKAPPGRKQKSSR